MVGFGAKSMSVKETYQQIINEVTSKVAPEFENSGHGRVVIFISHFLDAMLLTMLRRKWVRSFEFYTDQKELKLQEYLDPQSHYGRLPMMLPTGICL